MSNNCKWVKDDDGFKFYLPNCMGGAVNGPDGCTCKRGRISIEDSLQLAEDYKCINRELRTLISKLEARIKKLEDT